jgi:hypothetical protein
MENGGEGKMKERACYPECKNCRWDTPTENPRNLPMEPPKCPAHGEYMLYVEQNRPELKFIGAIYTCPKCSNSHSYGAPELTAYLKKICTNKNCVLKRKENQ